ncbi:hypothetical protein N9Y02_04720 [Flavobacteriaceae bacterium]|nr:hypothetical protein [Flavobacteriaceae bacterium]
MKRNISATYYIYILISLAVFSSCDDGDVAVQSFDFEDQSLSYCDNDQSILFYVRNSSGTEAVLADLTVNLTNLLSAGVLSYELAGSTNNVAYRIFDTSADPDYFCSAIPPTSPMVIDELIAISGRAEMLVVVNKDDLDGLSADDESPLDQDTDGDGLFDYIDFDDDGDNIPTAFELDVFNNDGDNNPLTNPLDTDQDGIPNYLDPDDDGDGVLTIDEDLNGDLDPTNDFTDPSIGPDYLNANIFLSTPQDAYREHNYQVVSSIDLTLLDLVLTASGREIIKEVLFMGSIPSFLTTTVTQTPSRD